MYMFSFRNKVYQDSDWLWYQNNYLPTYRSFGHSKPVSARLWRSLALRQRNALNWSTGPARGRGPNAWNLITVGYFLDWNRWRLRPLNIWEPVFEFSFVVEKFSVLSYYFFRRRPTWWEDQLLHPCTVLYLIIAWSDPLTTWTSPNKF